MNLTSPIANARRHFACGDICRWSGIKRAGPAMVMGRVAATNVFHQIMHSEHNEPVEIVADPDSADHSDPAALKKWFSPTVYPQFPPTMALSVGKQAIIYQPLVGVVWGSDQRAGFWPRYGLDEFSQVFGDFEREELMREKGRLRG